MPAKNRKQRPSAGYIPVDSFSDLAFLLIIFFILVTSLQKQSGFVTDIPSGQKSEAQPEKTTSITIRDDRISLNDQFLDVFQLRAKLQEMNLPARKAQEEKIVLLEAVGGVHYQTYFEVMAAISSAGGVIAIVKEDQGPKK
ncbi:MAG: biopolymer transporter ExbD [Planctomycetes bacterium]|nr:biopolymer transporter ExbD [Planctomycetota bacterium]